MKKLSFLIAICLVSYCGFSQKLTGLWNGTFSNDSTTLRTDQPFEIALSEYKGRVYGYSRREFIKNDTLYFVVKRVKGNIDGDLCEVIEDEFISHNFPVIDKGVKITYTFHFNKNDSSWSLDGKWKTNQVLKRKTGFYSLTGKVEMIEQKDLSKSKLFPHLAELKLDDDVPFYVAYKKQAALEEEQRNTAAKNLSVTKQPDLAKAEQPKKEPALVKQTEVKESSLAKVETNTKKENLPVKTEPIAVAPQTEIAKANTGKIKEQTSTKSDVPVSQPEVAKATEKEKTTVGKEKQKEQAQTTANTPVSSPTETAKSKMTEEKKKEEVIVKKEIAPVIATPVAAANVEKRKSVTQQVIDFANDSLTVALYDNGEIDGDTVSVLINGDIVMANQGLKATAIKKTIYITPAMKDSFTLVLYAENLGKYPPNTGLMIVHDGDDVYQIRFSADLQKNVAVIFKRKKK